MGDETNTGGGAAIQGDAKTADFTGRDTSAQRQAVRTGDTYYGGGSQGDMQIWGRLLDMAAQIRELTIQMDNLPSRVDRLERTEVVVRPGPEMVIRPTTPSPAPNSVNLPVWAIFLILTIALLLAVGLVVVLVLLRASNG